MSVLQLPRRERLSHREQPPPLVFLTGAEQAPAILSDADEGCRLFDVHRLALPGNVESAIEPLRRYVADVVRQAVYIVAAGTGCDVAVEFAARHPERVRRTALLFPEGSRRCDFALARSTIDALFQDPGLTDMNLVGAHVEAFARRSRYGALLECAVERLPPAAQPFLLILNHGAELCAFKARLAQARHVVMPRCCQDAHEQARLITRLTTAFLLNWSTALA